MSGVLKTAIVTTSNAARSRMILISSPLCAIPFGVDVEVEKRKSLESRQCLTSARPLLVSSMPRHDTQRHEHRSGSVGPPYHKRYRSMPIREIVLDVLPFWGIEFEGTSTDLVPPTICGWKSSQSPQMMRS